MPSHEQQQLALEFSSPEATVVFTTLLAERGVLFQLLPREDQSVPFTWSVIFATNVPPIGLDQFLSIVQN